MIKLLIKIVCAILAPFDFVFLWLCFLQSILRSTCISCWSPRCLLLISPSIFNIILQILNIQITTILIRINEKIKRRWTPLPWTLISGPTLQIAILHLILQRWLHLPFKFLIFQSLVALNTLKYLKANDEQPCDYCYYQPGIFSGAWAKLMWLQRRCHSWTGMKMHRLLLLEHVLMVHRLLLLSLLAASCSSLKISLLLLRVATLLHGLPSSALALNELLVLLKLMKHLNLIWWHLLLTMRNISVLKLTVWLLAILSIVRRPWRIILLLRGLFWARWLLFGFHNVLIIGLKSKIDKTICSNDN